MHGDPQNECEFIHYDLYPWNILLKVGSLEPVIIDYGKSCVHGNSILSMTTPSKFHDVLTILLSSLHEICK